MSQFHVADNIRLRITDPESTIKDRNEQFYIEVDVIFSSLPFWSALLLTTIFEYFIWRQKLYEKWASFNIDLQFYKNIGHEKTSFL